MVKVPEFILNHTLVELRPHAIKTQAELGEGFWIITEEDAALYFRTESSAEVYPEITIKQRREIARMIKRADLTRQVVISFHLPDGALHIDTFTIE